jgi:hypothetical protein
MGSSMGLGGGSSTRAQVANVVGRGVLDLRQMNRLEFRVKLEPYPQI